MGAFDFVRDAGAKVGIGNGAKGESKNVLEEASKIVKTSEVENLTKRVLESGIAIDNLKVTFGDGNVEVSGSVADQAAREKVILALGNVEGVASVKDSIKVNDSSAESKMYKVVEGDTLSKIAKSFYGDAAKYPAIFEANKPLLQDPDEIYVGQTLRIPAE